MHRLTREAFEETVDTSWVNSKQLYDIINRYVVGNNDDLPIDLNDVIEYANLRFDLWEYPKVIYYCYYGILQTDELDLKKSFLNIIINSLEKLKNYFNKNNIISDDLNHNEYLWNTCLIRDLIESVKIDTISLTSYSARKQSSMSRVHISLEEEIYDNYKALHVIWDYQGAFEEIYFLFTEYYLKENITSNIVLLNEFQLFCNEWWKIKN
jgi:hypothetical protein